MAFQKPPTVSDDYRAIGIYRQAADIIFEKGFEATSMEEIAETVDLTKGGLYYYIKGKKALLFAIMSFAMDRVENEVIHPARREEDPDNRLAAILTCYSRLVIEETSALAILIEETEALEEEHRQKIAVRQSLFYDFLRSAIAAVLERAERRQVDSEIAAQSAMGAMHWIVRWYPGTAYDSEAVADQLSRFILHGLIPDPP